MSRDGGHWYVSFLVEDGKLTPERHPSASLVGVDRGVAVAVACSDGSMHDREFTTVGERRRYRRMQQKLARQGTNSANRRKTIAAMRRVKRREMDRRRDFAAQVANRLATRHGLVVLEDLTIKGMTTSAKGGRVDPGRNIAAKAGLNRAILGKGWYRFELALTNVARYTGTRIVKVPAAYTSQTCSRCRSMDPESRESQAVFRCTRCGHSANADVNAAKNILAAGHAVTACGDLGAGQSVKQEPLALA
ncbi:transposase [Nocardia sp. NPDC051787]|uniref:RNA-guided endonuclease InsQ/TnpB family protein n=1 Tax=Nocardia sp. NPDC051787 TaxID=3155415 RepID=UPI0034259C22